MNCGAYDFHAATVSVRVVCLRSPRYFARAYCPMRIVSRMCGSEERMRSCQRGARRDVAASLRCGLDRDSTGSSARSRTVAGHRTPIPRPPATPAAVFSAGVVPRDPAFMNLKPWCLDQPSGCERTVRFHNGSRTQGEMRLADAARLESHSEERQRD